MGVKLVAADKCPLCGGNTANGECLACGYKPPDLNAIAAPYDLDPSNDAFGEAESLFEAVESPDISVGGEFNMASVALPDVSAAVNSSGRFASMGIQPIPNIKTAAPKAPPIPQNRQQTLANAPTNQPPAQNYIQATGFESFVKATADFFAKHWWKFLITLLAPTSGIIMAVVYLAIFFLFEFRKPDALAKGVLFGALGGFLISRSLDLFGLDAALQQILMFISEILD